MTERKGYRVIPVDFEEVYSWLLGKVTRAWKTDCPDDLELVDSWVENGSIRFLCRSADWEPQTPIPEFTPTYGRVRK